MPLTGVGFQPRVASFPTKQRGHYSVMRGYWNDEERTRETIDIAGWLHSGDLGVMDAEGYVRVVGRIKDMVIRGGENIYPREVEEFPMTVTGKIQKFVMREKMVAEFAGQKSGRQSRTVN